MSKDNSKFKMQNSKLQTFFKVLIPDRKKLLLSGFLGAVFFFMYYKCYPNLRFGYPVVFDYQCGAISVLLSYFPNFQIHSQQFVLLFWLLTFLILYVFVSCLTVIRKNVK